MIPKEHTVDWSQMLNLIHLTGMENSLKNQYQNASNISARINLHSLYSAESTRAGFPGSLPAVARLQPGMQILEIGCGDGALWTENLSRLPEDVHITLSDISEGMLRDARRAVGGMDPRFSFKAFDCHQIFHSKMTAFDLVIANHVLFYCDRYRTGMPGSTAVYLKPGGALPVQHLRLRPHARSQPACPGF